MHPKIEDPPNDFVESSTAWLDTASTQFSCVQESWPSAGGEILVVSVNGELDLLTRSLVATTLIEAVSRAPRHLVIDLAPMTFCCVQGYDLLAETAFVARARGIAFALSGLTTHQHRVVALILPPPRPQEHRSVAAAVTAIRALSAS